MGTIVLIGLVTQQIITEWVQLSIFVLSVGVGDITYLMQLYIDVKLSSLIQVKFKDYFRKHEEDLLHSFLNTELTTVNPNFVEQEYLGFDYDELKEEWRALSESGQERVTQNSNSEQWVRCQI